MQYLNEAELHSGWARGRIKDPTAGADKVRRILSAFVDQGVRVNLGFYTGLLAELEAETLGADSALARIDEAFSLSEQVEHRCSLPFLHRLRGELLLKRDPTNPAPAEEAFQIALAIAKQQRARSPDLLASLSLAKLYQSTSCPADAHAVLAPALEGFAPTPEMPEIAEAQALLAELEGTDEVKADKEQRERRLRLQTGYGYATMWSKGFAADETKVAFERAAELAAHAGDFSERFAAAHGQWLNALLRGKMSEARSLASSLLREAEDAGRKMEVLVARRGLAAVLFFCGEFREARNECERLLNEPSEPEHDRQIRERFGDDISAISMSWLAVTDWQLGEIDRARELIETSKQRAIELGHVASMATPLFVNSCLEFLRGDAAAALRAAEAMEVLGRDQGMVLFGTEGELLSAAARGQLTDPVAGAIALRQALAAYFDQGAKLNARFFGGLLAQLELKASGAQSALTIIDEAFAQQDPGGTLGSRIHASSPRRHPAEVDPSNLRPGRGCLQDRHRDREGTGRTKLPPPGCALARQALPIDRPPRRRPRRPRAGARRFCADARNAGDRRGAGAVGGYRGRRACEARINTAMGWLSCYSE